MCTYKKDIMAGDVMAGGVMVGGNPTENALKARSQAERLQTDRVWVQEPRSLEAHELSSAEWLQLLGDVADTRMLGHGHASWKTENFIPLQMHRRMNVRLPST